MEQRTNDVSGVEGAKPLTHLTLNRRKLFRALSFVICGGARNYSVCTHTLRTFRASKRAPRGPDQPKNLYASTLEPQPGRGRVAID